MHAREYQLMVHLSMSLIAFKRTGWVHKHGLLPRDSRNRYRSAIHTSGHKEQSESEGAVSDRNQRPMSPKLSSGVPFVAMPCLNRYQFDTLRLSHLFLDDLKWRNISHTAIRLASYQVGKKLYYKLRINHRCFSRLWECCSLYNTYRDGLSAVSIVMLMLTRVSTQR